MGTRTDAVLFFGIIPKDGKEYVEDFSEWEDWEERVLRSLGLEDDSNFFTKDGEYALPDGDKRKEAEKKYDAWHKKKTKALKDLGVEVDQHCHGDNPMPMIAVTETVLTASRGYPEIVSGKHLDPEKKWIEQLKKFCELLDVKYESPQWYMVSYWG